MITSSQKEDSLPIKEPKTKEYRAAFKGALIGSAGAVFVSVILLGGQPAKASATVLLPSLGTIINQLTTQFNLLTDYVDQWLPDINEIFERAILNQFPEQYERSVRALRGASEEHAGYHALGNDAQVSAINVLNDLVRNANGEIDPVAASDYLLPPLLDNSGSLNEAELNRIRDHALLMTQDQPIPQPNGWTEGTTMGTYQEYRRLNVIQQRLLSQDAITQYPLHSAKMNGYKSYLADVQSAGASGSLTPGQLLSTQLSVMADVAVPATLDALASDLRRERLLGAQLATMANEFYETEGRRLADQGQ